MLKNRVQAHHNGRIMPTRTTISFEKLSQLIGTCPMANAIGPACREALQSMDCRETNRQFHCVNAILIGRHDAKPGNDIAAPQIRSPSRRPSRHNTEHRSQERR